MSDMTSETVKNDKNHTKSLPPRKNGTKVGIVVLVVILTVIVGIVVWLVFHKPTEPQYDKGSVVITEDKRVGSNPADRVAAGMIVAKMTAEWTFADGNAAGNGYVANSKQNSAPLKITVALADTGEVLLETDPIPVGSCVENFKLGKTLDKGDYAAVVTHSTVDENGEVTNSIRTEIVIHVLN